MNPINWALKNNETTHGVTLHELTPYINDGPIVGQLLYSIYPECDEVIDVYGRALEYGYTLFTQTMPMLENIVPRSQNEAEATYYSKENRALLAERSDFTRGLSEPCLRNDQARMAVGG
jgi:methionyl-tRNA formyltransferase